MDFKLKCIKTKNSPIAPGASAYKGKIYIFEDGRTTWENGSESFSYDSAEDFFKHNVNLRGYFEEIKEVELTFKEVVANIKEGEVWENASLARNLKEINRKGRLIRFVFTDTDRGSFAIDNDDTFILQRKEYIFQEAFKAYEEGKEIESISYRYKIINEQDKYYSKLEKEWIDNDTFDVDEIKGKWYIND
ncbi:hypothetical protein [Clostridium sp. 1001275B_160808_H3]|uniref:hypothetical protein n=1 Tax=Clostridium sp. 1001275B_160808_H3 TaxID=2787110 RepID=UPI001896E925|nr:hypothetical protein [Clostridium sp. 1001275B_160808_H3]